VPSSTSTGTFLTSLTTTSSSTQLFTRVLRRGDEGEDVRLLQTLLNKYSFTLAPSGNGSPSQETTFFGPRTERALTKFQEFYASDILTPINKVKGSGVFGLLSRLKMEQLEGR
jgi:peptidoglycan hydrolase-like protein with peptidoglycan-binding domain